MRKKIAILISGHLRCVSKTLANMKRYNPEFFDSNITDVFVHTWKGENKSCWSLYPSQGWRFTNTHCPSYMCKMFSMSYLKDKINVVSSLEEEDQTSEPMAMFGHNKYVISIASMIYARQKVYSLMEEYSKANNVSYDIVIRTRPDIRYDSSIPIDDLIEKINTNKCELFVPQGQEWGGITDQMSIGSMRAIKTVCDLYETIKKNKDGILNAYSNRLPESVENMLAQHIGFYGLNYEVIPIKHGLYRYVEIDNNVMECIKKNNEQYKDLPDGHKWKPIPNHPYGFSQADIDCGLMVEEVDGINYLTFGA